MKSSKVCFCSNKFNILPSRRKPRQTKPCLFRISVIKKRTKTVPYLLEYAKDQNKSLGSENEAISHYFQCHLPHLPCKEVHLLPQLPLHKVIRVNNEEFNRFLSRLLVCRHTVSSWRNIDIWRPRFRSWTSISLTWRTFLNILTPTVLCSTDFALTTALNIIMFNITF